MTLSKICFPGKMTSWNQNTYQKEMIEGIKKNLIDQIQAGNPDAYTASGVTVSEETAEVIATDALNVVTTLVAKEALNKSSGFLLKVNQGYTNYCNALLSGENGIDAMLQTLYLTHGFEYQISEDITTFLNEMILKTGTYGIFVANVNGLSDFAKDSEKTDQMTRFCNAVKTLEEALDHALTRGQAIALLWENEGSPASKGTLPFTDVKYNKEDILWAYENGLVVGYGNQIMGAKDPITKEQALCILQRYAKWKGTDISLTDIFDLSGYEDAEDSSSYARSVFGWFLFKEILPTDGLYLYPQELLNEGRYTRMMDVVVSL